MEDKEELFISIYESTKDRVYRICHYYVSGNDYVNDLFQEVYINVWKSLEKFRKEASVETWIYRIAVNTSINFIKLEKRKTRNRGNIENIPNISSDTQEEPQVDPEITEQLLYKCITQLSMAEKTIISFVLEGLSYKEIAGICDISDDLLRVRIHRIKKKLKKMLYEKRNGI